MDQIEIIGGQSLKGEIAISGAKNAALPLMVASLLTDQPLVLDNVPELADIASLQSILEQHGVSVETQHHGDNKLGARLTLSVPEITSTLAPYDLVRKMRASFLVIGPLVARCEQATVSLPGGCAIGTRPVDLHLMGLERLGATIELEEGYVSATAKGGLVGNRIEFPFVSVGATQNMLMAACLAKGESELVNAAREPEIGDLVKCLQGMGAQIEGVGTSTLRVQGVDHLQGTEHSVLPDRIETGTFAMAVGAAGGSVTLRGTNADLIASVIPVLDQAGVHIKETGDGMVVTRDGDRHRGVDIETEPFPGFPTDLQAQYMALMTNCKGQSVIQEKIFENRFMHVPELCRMGARISVHGDTATVEGLDRLTGAPVMATDLRASVSLVIAALGAEGKSTVSRVYHLDRGFERLEEKLTKVGAQIRRTKAS